MKTIAFGSMTNGNQTWERFGDPIRLRKSFSDLESPSKNCLEMTLTFTTLHLLQRSCLHTSMRNPNILQRCQEYMPHVRCK
jgi:hypothetical protein